MNAVNIDYDIYLDREESNSDFDKVRTIKTKAKVKTNSVLVFYVISSLVIASVLSLFHVHYMNVLSSVKDNIETLKMENNKLEKEIRLAQTRLSELYTDNDIEIIAREKLGMIYPTDENRVFINSSDEKIMFAEEKSNNDYGFVDVLLKGNK